MSELVFPVLGAAFVVVVVLPLAAALALVLSTALDRLRGARLVRWGGARLALLVLPCLLPLAWVVSAGVHQSEPGRAVLACLLGHEIEQLCLEPLAFVALLLVFVGWRLWPLGARLWAARKASLREHAPERARVAALIRNCPLLSGAADRFRLGDIEAAAESDDVDAHATPALLNSAGSNFPANSNCTGPVIST